MDKLDRAINRTIENKVVPTINAILDDDWGLAEALFGGLCRFCWEYPNRCDDCPIDELCRHAPHNDATRKIAAQKPSVIGDLLGLKMELEDL